MLDGESKDAPGGMLLLELIGKGLDADSDPASLAIGHTKRAVVCWAMGDDVEAYAALELAWEYAEMEPDPHVVAWIRGAEKSIREA